MSTDENTLTQEQALNVILQGVVRGQRSGVYSLAEAEIISKAIRLFNDQRKEQEQKEKESPKIETSDVSNIQI